MNNISASARKLSGARGTVVPASKELCQSIFPQKKRAGESPLYQDNLPAGQQHRGREIIFSFQETVKTYVSKITYNQSRCLPPAAPSAVCEYRNVILFYRSLCQNVHWTALHSSKFSQIRSVHTVPPSSADAKRNRS